MLLSFLQEGLARFGALVFRSDWYTVSAVLGIRSTPLFMFPANPIERGTRSLPSSPLSPVGGALPPTPSEDLSEI